MMQITQVRTQEQVIKFTEYKLMQQEHLILIKFSKKMLVVVLVQHYQQEIAFLLDLYLLKTDYLYLLMLQQDILFQIIGK